MPSPNLKKQLVDELKKRGVKTTSSGKRGIAVDGRTLATVYDAANDSIRLFVVAKPKLPAKLAKPFTLTKTRGYAKRFKLDDDLTPAVDAIEFVATQSDEPSTKPKSTKAKSTKSKIVVDVEGRPDVEDAIVKKLAEKSAT